MHQFYVLNAPHNVPLSRRYTLQILPKYTSFIVEIRPKFARFRAANASQIALYLPAFCPLSGRNSPAFCPYFARNLPTKVPQTCLYNATNTPVMCCKSIAHTHPFNVANMSERRRKTPVLRRKSINKHACLSSKNDLQLTALSEPSLTKIFALGLIVNICCSQSVASRLIRNRCRVLSVLINNDAAGVAPSALQRGRTHACISLRQQYYSAAGAIS